MPKRLTHLDRDGATAITSKSWPDLEAGVTDVPQKFGVENAGTVPLGSTFRFEFEQVGVGDGYTFARGGLDTETLSRPYGLQAVVGGTGGLWGGTGLQYYRITALTDSGETTGSLEVSASLTDTDQTVTLTWTELAGATGYRIYRTATTGVYGASSLRVEVGATGTYEDDGDALSAGTVPAVNTTGGWTLVAALSAPGAGGGWGSTGTRYWRVVAVDADSIEIAHSLEASATIDVVTKIVTLTWDEVAEAASIRVYRSTTSGDYATPALRATLTGDATEYQDTGGAVSAGGLTSEPSYGIPTALTTGPINLGAMAVSQQRFYWLAWVVPDATPDNGNPRTFNLRFKDT